MIELDSLEEDALREMFNVGIGRAAHALSRMVHAEVHLSIPYLEVVSRAKAIAMVRERTSEQVAAIRQDFSGLFGGTAFLIYPETSSLKLVHSLLGEETPLEYLTELEQETLLEVGNVILNACLGTFANMMALELNFDIPEYMKGECAELLKVQFLARDSDQDDHQGKHVVFLLVDFLTGDETCEKNSIKGFVILLLDTTAVTILKAELGKLTRSL